jgi:hypothetical protein
LTNSSPKSTRTTTITARRKIHFTFFQNPDPLRAAIPTPVSTTSNPTVLSQHFQTKKEGGYRIEITL